MKVNIFSGPYRGKTGFVVKKQKNAMGILGWLIRLKDDPNIEFWVWRKQPYAKYFFLKKA